MSHETRSQLWAIRSPTLVLVGEHDFVNPPSIAREVAELIHRADFTILPGVGHLPHVEDVGVFRVRIATFLERLS
jgi:pimeloyl-ACP methyl ester carboxylesterase